MQMVRRLGVDELEHARSYFRCATGRDPRVERRRHVRRREDGEQRAGRVGEIDLESAAGQCGTRDRDGGRRRAGDEVGRQRLVLAVAHIQIEWGDAAGIAGVTVLPETPFVEYSGRIETERVDRIID